MPSCLPRSSLPCRDFFSHLPACSSVLARGSWRPRASMRPMVSSATAMALAPGVFITTIPRLVAASASILSTPTPARPITRNLGADSSSFWSTCTADRTTRASVSANSAANPFLIWSWVTTFQPLSPANTANVAGETFSANTIFINLLRLFSGQKRRQQPLHSVRAPVRRSTRGGQLRLPRVSRRRSGPPSAPSRKRSRAA